jgi:putative hemolysin
VDDVPLVLVTVALTGTVVALALRVIRRAPPQPRDRDDDRRLREVLVPRRDVCTLASGMPAASALKVLARAGRSRAPVVGPAGLDDVVGVVQLRDLVGADGPVDAVTHPALLIPETVRVPAALRQMRADRQRMALVVDEAGAVEGIVTLTGLIEGVAGDSGGPPVVTEPDGALLLPGAFPLHHLPFSRDRDGGCTTVAGLVLAELGHIPTGPGEVVRLDEFTAEVAEVTGRAITGVRLRATSPGGLCDFSTSARPEA